MSRQTQTLTQASRNAAPLSSSLQRKCDCGQHTIGGGDCSECGKKQSLLQRARQNSELGTRKANGVPPIVHEVLNSPGQPLDAATRSFMEPRFGHDFSRVRLHTDAKAAESARAVNALAYTVGSDVVFGTGQYAPWTSRGNRLVAHELSHVVQQASGMMLKDEISSPDDPAEREADVMADRVVAGEPADVPKTRPVVRLHRTSIASCSADEKGKIEKGLTQAGNVLTAALAALSGPMTPLLQKILWYTLRSKGDAADLKAVNADLTAVKSRLPTASLECSDKGVLICSDDETKGTTNMITNTIYVCSAALKGMSDLVLTRTLIHEGLHAFAAKSSSESYHDDDCTEGDLPGTSRVFRLGNADSVACTAMLISSSAAGIDLDAEVAHSKGEDLALNQKPAGPIKLSGPENTPEFELSGFSNVGVKGIRWVLKDDNGRKYLLRRGSEIIDPSGRVDWVGKIIIGAKTRSLLRERGITQVHLFAIVDIPEVGLKETKLDLTLVP